MVRGAHPLSAGFFFAGVAFYAGAVAVGIYHAVYTDGSPPGLSLDYTRRIKEHVTQGAFDLATAQAKVAIALDHASEHVAQQIMGAALAQQDKTEEAIDHFRQALAFQPRYADAHFGLAMALAKRGEQESTGRRFAEAAAALGEAIGHFQRALDLDPKHATARDYRSRALGLYVAALTSEGRDLSRSGQHRKAQAKYREAITADPKNAQAYNYLAEILAAHPNANLRNGPAALRYAQRACQLTEYQNAVALQTLAEAYAEAGRFPDAVNSAEQAMDVAKSTGQLGLADQIDRFQLPLYRSGRPFRRPDW